MNHENHDYRIDTRKAEVRTFIVMVMTGVMMAAEIAAGTLFGSMALLADGWHMGTHMAAFLIAVVAYAFAKRQSNNNRFSFGTGKIGVLGGFTSSILLLVVVVVMIAESVERLLNPGEIRFRDALIVAVIGLAVNLVSALILRDAGGHGHTHGGHAQAHHHDKNLKAAYLHVVTDAFTSVTAIIALVIGYYTGIVWIDVLMGFLGSIVILVWAAGMIRDTATILVDYTPKTSDLGQEITKSVTALEGTRINDLHIWQVASGKFAAIVSIEADVPKTAREYHDLIDVHEELVHVTVQVC